MIVLATVSVAPSTFFAIIAASALAATIAATAAGRGLLLPVVVVELLFGVVLGPEVIGLHVNVFVSFFSDLGLGLLFFFAGYEIDLHRILGAPLRLGVLGWLCSRSHWLIRSAVCSPPPVWCSRSCTRARLWPPPRSAR